MFDTLFAMCRTLGLLPGCRAGRCQEGVCYHLFSRARYESLPEYQVPEILRQPLQGLCFDTKLLAPQNTSIADFLAKAPEPPAFLIIRNAVQLLKVGDQCACLPHHPQRREQ